jgi:uncharacterized RDD family membrane protein YckC
MRCPKCHYISYDTGDRCRNCGYEFALATETKGVELPIRAADTPDGPLSDLDLGGQPAALPKAPMTTSSELPLFTDRGYSAVAEKAAAVPARPPLAVRKSNQPLVRTRSRTDYEEEPTLDLGTPQDPQEPTGRPGAVPSITLSEKGFNLPAPLVRRAAAALLDAVIVGSIQVAVVFMTLEVAGVGGAEIGIIPLGPLASFLLLLAGGYVVSFTAAGGQTIGKMAAGIRVIPTDDADDGSGRVPVESAVIRAVAMLISVLPLGLGLVPALFTEEHRTLPDRLADTRVVVS